MQTPLSPSPIDPIGELIARWRADPNSTCQTWFLWEERLKNFRSIRRGIEQVIAEIESGTFGSAYKGSSLETVVGAIAEQRQIFKGADHAFLWKPKLQIPAIYEYQHRDNQLAFARFLKTCMCCTTEEKVVAAIWELDDRRIKGLGPAAANLIYFLHPTIAPPFNTAIVKGYNVLTGAKVKLGRWDEYLAMRSGIAEMNARYRHLLSNDFGAIASLLFDVGSGRYDPPRPPDDEEALKEWLKALEGIRVEAPPPRPGEQSADRTHTEVQGWLRDLGRELGFGVWVAANDRGRTYAGGRLDDGCLETLPEALAEGESGNAVRLIDVLWLEAGTGRVAGAFEVEHTTSIYSGIVRLLDLALGAADAARGLFLVAPDDREQQVRDQLGRPAFSRIGDLRVRFLPYSELEAHRHAMARFGQGMKPVEAVARALT